MERVLIRRPSHGLLVLFVLAGIWAWVAGPLAPRSVAAEVGAPLVVTRSPGEVQHDSVTDFTLAGRVVDHQGWPIAGARVQPVDGGVVVCGASGTFTTTVRGPGPHTLEISADSFEPRTESTFVGDDLVVVMPRSLPWSAPRGTPESEESAPETGDTLAGEGFLRDAQGEPIANGLIMVFETGVRAIADAVGRYRVALPKGSAMLTAHDGESLVARMEIPATKRKRGLVPLPDLILAPAHMIRGYVKHATGDPCAGASVCVTGEGLVLRGTTSPSGSFALAGLISGEYELEALPFEGSLGVRQRLDVASEGIDLELSLGREEPMAIKVIDGGGGTQAGVWVLGREGDLRQAHGQTNDQGQVTLRGLGQGPFSFDVRTPLTFETFEILGFDVNQGLLTVRVP